MEKKRGKVAGVLLVNQKKEVLLYLRDNKSSIPHPNHWALIGGHLEKGESFLDALKREVKEEIGYIIKDVEFLGELNDKVGNLVYVYRADINKNLNEIKLTEGQKLGFFSFKEIKKLKVPKILKDFIIENKNRVFK